jgi:hypothetical protein
MRDLVDRNACLCHPNGSRMAQHVRRTPWHAHRSSDGPEALHNSQDGFPTVLDYVIATPRFGRLQQFNPNRIRHGDSRPALTRLPSVAEPDYAALEIYPIPRQLQDRRHPASSSERQSDEQTQMGFSGSTQEALILLAGR